MTSLRHHHSSAYIKLLAMGDSKAGKTMSLASLVAAGYKLRIIDLDNLLDGLRNLILRDCPDKIDNVEVRTLRDGYVANSTGYNVTKPHTYLDTVRLLAKWKYTDIDGIEIDLGDPGEWGPDCVLVIDSLSRLCDAAWNWREPLTPRGKSGDFDPRVTYGDAQDAVENILAGLTAPDFKTNVIVIAHIAYMEMPGGKKKGFPQGVGQALSPKIPQYFPTVIYYALGPSDKRTLFTASTPLIDLANPAPFALSDTYPTDTGLAEIFRILRENPSSVTKETPPKPEPKPTRLSKPTGAPVPSTNTRR